MGTHQLVFYLAFIVCGWTFPPPSHPNPKQGSPENAKTGARLLLNRWGYIHVHVHVHSCSLLAVFLLLYLKRGTPPCLWVAGLQNADSCNSGLQYSSSSQVLWVSLASHSQLRDTLLVVEMYSSGCTSVHSTCTHSRLYIHMQVHIAKVSLKKQIIPSSWPIYIP